MRDLDKSKVYDLSELTQEEREILYEHLCNFQEELKLVKVDDYDILEYKTYNKWVYYHYNTSCIEYKYKLTNAKELFYTLENIQVDCRYLTEEQIKEMSDVYKNNGFRIGTLYLCDDYFFLSYKCNNYCFVNQYKEEKTTITYEKFMELFGNKEKTEEFNNLVDVSNEELTEEYNNSQFKQIANSLADLLEYKNKMYGNSALEPLNIFNNKCKVGQRLDDKLARIKNSNELRKNDICDLIGYLILTCKENNWTNFDEFKD